MNLKSLSLSILITAICFMDILARENPFVPVITPQESGEISLKQKVKYFTKESIELPSTARVLKKIIVEYQNLDGSIELKEVVIDRDMDWHYPIIAYQNNISAQKDNVFEFLADGTMKKDGSKDLNPLNFISFSMQGNKIYINTKDELIRDFLVTDPNRVVLDFKRDANFLSKTISTFRPYITDIILGNHNGFYRVVLRLDGKYDYKLTKLQDRYLIELE